MSFKPFYVFVLLITQVAWKINCEIAYSNKETLPIKVYKTSIPVSIVSTTTKVDRSATILFNSLPTITTVIMVTPQRVDSKNINVKSISTTTISPENIETTEKQVIQSTTLSIKNQTVSVDKAFESRTSTIVEFIFKTNNVNSITKNISTATSINKSISNTTMKLLISNSKTKAKPINITSLKSTSFTSVPNQVKNNITNSVSSASVTIAFTPKKQTSNSTATSNNINTVKSTYSTISRKITSPITISTIITTTSTSTSILAAANLPLEPTDISTDNYDLNLFPETTANIDDYVITNIISDYYDILTTAVIIKTSSTVTSKASPTKATFTTKRLVTTTTTTTTKSLLTSKTSTTKSNPVRSTTSKLLTFTTKTAIRTLITSNTTKSTNITSAKISATKSTTKSIS